MRKYVKHYSCKAKIIAVILSLFWLPVLLTYFAAFWWDIFDKIGKTNFSMTLRGALIFLEEWFRQIVNKVIWKSL